MRSTTILAATLAVTLVACSDSASTVSGLAPPNGPRLVLTPADAQIVMNSLDNPRGLAFSPDGVLYVTEAGRGGTSPCMTVPQVCYGPTGAVSRLRKGVQERFATGLPSLVSANGVAQAGPNDIAFLGVGDAYVTTGLQASPFVRALLGEVGSEFGQLVHLTASGKWRFIVDVAAYEAANNPDGRLSNGAPVFDSNPYGLLAVRGAHIVTDANALLRVSANNEISLLAVFHSRGSIPPRRSFAPAQFDSLTDAVPTSVVIGPDGAYYVSELTGVPFTDTRANIYRVVPGEPSRLFLTQDACVGGFKMIMD
ncbi:MAG TPA: ScyD/ScyE family protein, partial [Gemmatimonadaceae bacterium]|nr:ScyD/ScyE family protein [Gemmatimonadaceae bacterium]